MLEEPLDRNVPVTIERIAHLIVNPLIDYHMPVIYHGLRHEQEIPYYIKPLRFAIANLLIQI